MALRRWVPYIAGMRRPLASVLVSFMCLVACGPKPAEQPAPTPQPAAPAPVTEPEGEPAACSVDADCVPAGCCHPSTCVPVAQKPTCTDVMCTMNCQPGTLDCGGRCACEAGSCKAILGQP
jgi:hypothetical protein